MLGFPPDPVHGAGHPCGLTQVGDKGIEPPGDHHTIYKPTALQAAVWNISQSSKDRIRTCKHLILSQAALRMAYFAVVVEEGIEPSSLVLQTSAKTTSATPPYFLNRLLMLSFVILLIVFSSIEQCERYHSSTGGKNPMTPLPATLLHF